MDEIEIQFVNAFIVRRRKPRWLESLASKKKRRKFLDCLNHCRDFDERFCTHVRTDDDAVELLARRGAPNECYLLSDSEFLDGVSLPMGKAVFETCTQRFGTVLIFIPSRLAYYIDECGERRIVLSRA